MVLVKVTCPLMTSDMLYRFESVTDRFITELGPIAAGQIPKEMDFKFENLVKGLKHIQIKVSLEMCFLWFDSVS